MVVKLGSVSGDKRSISRTMTNITTADCQPFQNCDVLQPRIIVNVNMYSPTDTHFTIDDWHRTYEITSAEFMTGQRVLISGKVDVLFTYADIIKNSTQWIIRCSDINNNNVIHSLIPDTLRPIKEHSAAELVQITGDGLEYLAKSGGGYYVTTLGGTSGKFATKPQTDIEQEVSN